MPKGFNRRPVSVMSVIARFSGYALMLLISAFIVLPFVWMFLSSVKDNNEIFVVPVQWFPKTWHWEHYLQIWSKADMWRWLLNTLFFAVVVTFLQGVHRLVRRHMQTRKSIFPAVNTLFLILTWPPWRCHGRLTWSRNPERCRWLGHQRHPVGSIILLEASWRIRGVHDEAVLRDHPRMSCRRRPDLTA